MPDQELVQELRQIVAERLPRREDIVHFDDFVFARSDNGSGPIGLSRLRQHELDELNCSDGASVLVMMDQFFVHPSRAWVFMKTIPTYATRSAGHCRFAEAFPERRRRGWWDFVRWYRFVTKTGRGFVEGDDLVELIDQLRGATA